MSITIGRNVFHFVKLTPRTFIVTRHTGTYGVLKGVTLDPVKANHAEIVCGPTSYDEAATYFIEQTKAEPKQPSQAVNDWEGEYLNWKEIHGDE